MQRTIKLPTTFKEGIVLAITKEYRRLLSERTKIGIRTAKKRKLLSKEL